VKRNPRGIACAALLLALLAPAAADAQKALAPAAQPAMFDKIFGYDRALGDRNSLRVLLVRSPGAAGLAEIETEFEKLGIQAEQVAADAVAGRLGPAVVVYLSGDNATPALLEQIATAKALSITGEPALVDAGRAAVSVADNGGRQEIVVNLERVGREGHVFQAQLMKIARVVRGADSPAPPAGGGGETRAPVLVHLDRPAYPEVARRSRVEGDVVMRLQVDTNGAVTSVELLRGVDRAPGMAEAALRAARGARFRPALRDGKPVAGVYTLTMPFRL
jgi:TonB family protein